MILQLNPAIPVDVVNFDGPNGPGIAHLVIDYGIESHLVFVVAMDLTGQVWSVPNPSVRFQTNLSAGRIVQKG